MPKEAVIIPPRQPSNPKSICSKRITTRSTSKLKDEDKKKESVKKIVQNKKMYTKNKKQHNCKLCLDLNFDTIDELQLHLSEHHHTTDINKNDKDENEKHSTIKLFECNLCQMIEYENIEQLENHIKRIHFNETPYECGICPTQYWELSYFLTHLNDDHKTVENINYRCKWCLKILQTKNCIIEHQCILYTTPTPISTTTISSSSSSSSTSPSKSLITNNNVNPSKIFDCSKCSETFECEKELLLHKREHANEEKAYACNECNRRFTRSEDLYIHLRIHRGQSIYECNICERMFAQQKNFNNHMQNVHKYDVDYIPNNNNNNNESKNNNSNANDDKEIKLLINVSQPDSNDVNGKQKFIPTPQTNLILHKNDLVRNYKCPLCVLAFVKMKSLEIHCKRNHPGNFTIDQLNAIEKDVEKSIMNSDFDKLKNAQIINSIKCSCCDEYFQENTNLMVHLNQKHNGGKPYRCSRCKMVFARSLTLLEHIRIHIRKQHKCMHCNVTFQTLPALQKHGKRHEGSPLIRCTVCSIPYSEEKDLVRHMRTHAEGRPHKCTYCDKRFAQSCDKIKHMRIHTGERPYKCKECGKTFAHLTSIKKHEIVHSGERSFQCTWCGKSFQHNSNLVVHTRTHTGERPYKCTVCNKSFYASGHYTDHIKIHIGEKNFKCDVCDKLFLHKSSFHKHKRTHTGERPFHCTFCNRNFSQPGHFKEHLRIHTGEKPYACQICSKAFRRSDALNIHKKTHTNYSKKSAQTCARGKSIATIKIIETEGHSSTTTTTTAADTNIEINDKNTIDDDDINKTKFTEISSSLSSSEQQQEIPFLLQHSTFIDGNGKNIILTFTNNTDTINDSNSNDNELLNAVTESYSMITSNDQLIGAATNAVPLDENSINNFTYSFSY